MENIWFKQHSDLSVSILLKKCYELFRLTNVLKKVRPSVLPIMLPKRTYRIVLYVWSMLISHAEEGLVPISHAFTEPCRTMFPSSDRKVSRRYCASQLYRKYSPRTSPSFTLLHDEKRGHKVHIRFVRLYTVSTEFHDTALLYMV